MRNSIRVVLVDDHAMVREGIRHVLTGMLGIEVVGEASDGARALTTIRALKPDVVLLDITLPGKSGLEVAKELRDEMANLKILVLSMHDEAQYIVEAVKAGVNGYLLKDAGAEELRKAVVAVYAGTEYFSAGVINHLGAAVRQQPSHQPSPVDRLTPREQQVLISIASGRTNKETAGALGISPRTVETHRESIMRKTDIKTVAGLTRFALQAGLLVD